LERPRKATENISQDRWCPGQDLNQAPAGYKKHKKKIKKLPPGPTSSGSPLAHGTEIQKKMARRRRKL
jgi:hypothetical protein